MRNTLFMTTDVYTTSNCLQYFKNNNNSNNKHQTPFLDTEITFYKLFRATTIHICLSLNIIIIIVSFTVNAT